MKCINALPSDKDVFFHGEGVFDKPCPYEPVSVKITYNICNFDSYSSLILEKKSTQLMYNGEDVTPMSITSAPLKPEECVSHIHRSKWNLCDVNGVGQRITQFSVKVEGFLVAAESSSSSSSPASSSSSSKGSKSKGKGGESSWDYGPRVLESNGKEYSKGYNSNSQGRNTKSSKSSKSAKGYKGNKDTKSLKSSKSSRSSFILPSSSVSKSNTNVQWYCK